MELTLIYGCALVLSILAISIYSLSNLRNGPGLPPGKLGLPLIGESIEYISNFHNVNLEMFSFKRMKRYNTDDVFKTSILGDDVAMLCGAAGNNFLFSKGNKMVKRWVPKQVQLIATPPELEVAVDQYLKPAYLVLGKLDVLKTFTAVMDSMAQQHLESYWHPLQVIKVCPSVKRYTFTVACRLLLSIEDPDVVEMLYDPVETWALGLASMPINLPGTQMNRSLKAGKFLRSRILKIVKERRSSMNSSPVDSHKDNILSFLIQTCDDDIVVTHGALGVLLAGHETVSSVISMMIKVMAPNGNHPDVYRKVYQENMEIVKEGEFLTVEDTRKMKYTWNVACEVMRLYPPGPFSTRETLIDLNYAGYYIPKGYKMMSNIHATHKDPKHFPEPQKFDPSRFEGEGPLPYTFTPFGGGLFKCPGSNYAQQVALVFIHNVVKKFKWETVVADEKISGIPVPKPSQGLPVILHPHSNKSD